MTGTSIARAQPVNRDVYTLACERVAETLDRFDHVAVSFSGGKDSTAVLNIVLEVAASDPRWHRHLPLRVFFSDEEAIPYETEAYVRRVTARSDVSLEWYCIPVKHRNACSRKHPHWWPWAPEDEARWCRPLPPEAITRVDGFPLHPAAARTSWPDTVGLMFPPTLGNCAMFLGIRAQESITRYRALAHRSRELNYLVRWSDGTSAGNLWKSYPVYDWLTEDVWTAPAMRGWDYNRAYDRLEAAGVSRPQQRCSPAFGEEPLQKIHTYAACFPEVWERMVERVPGIGAATRYARTELYAYGGHPDRPAGMPWPDFITRYLSKFEPPVAASVAARVHGEVRRHYRKTRDPILAYAAHPASGVSWRFLLTLAMRGDFKGRKQPMVPSETDPDAVARAWRKYAAELDQTLTAGTFADLAHPTPAPADPYDLIPPQYRQETTS